MLQYWSTVWKRPEGLFMWIKHFFYGFCELPDQSSHTFEKTTAFSFDVVLYSFLSLHNPSWFIFVSYVKHYSYLVGGCCKDKLILFCHHTNLPVSTCIIIIIILSHLLIRAQQYISNISAGQYYRPVLGRCRYIGTGIWFTNMRQYLNSF